MNIEYIEIHKNEWLTDALRRGGYDDMIPSNVILNKTLTGIGATRCELYAHRNSIIIEPNVPVIQCKLEKRGFMLAWCVCRHKTRFYTEIPYKRGYSL